MTPHFSTVTLGIVLVIAAGFAYAAIVLYGAWIDGKRQKMREKGLHPVTRPDGSVEAREQEEHDGNEHGKHEQR